MSSRKEQKERLRQERLAREKAAKEAAARRRRFQLGGGIAVVVAALVVVVVLVAAGGGSGKPGHSTSAATAGAQAGVQTGAAPWQPEYSFLAQRLSALNLPGQSDLTFHIHAALFIYIDGKQITVPANFGIDPQGRFIAPVHTHDNSGIIHMEATRPYPFTLGQMFDIWGVKFSDSQIGGYRSGVNGNVLQVWVNGKRVADPLNYVMKAHDVMIVGYGKPGSFPTKKQFSFPNGL